MTTVIATRPQTFPVAPGYELTITVPPGGAALVRMTDGLANVTIATIASDTTHVYGPYGTTVSFSIQAFGPELSVVVALPDGDDGDGGDGGTDTDALVAAINLKEDRSVVDALFQSGTAKALGKTDVSIATTPLLPVPLVDSGTLVATRLQAWLNRARDDRGLIVTMPVGGYQPKAPLYLGSETVFEGAGGSGFGNSTRLVPQGDYPAIASTNYYSVQDVTRSTLRGFHINPINLVGGSNYALDFDGFSLLDIHDLFVQSDGGENWNGMRLINHDSVTMFNPRIMGCTGAGLRIGQGGQNVRVFGGNFESFTGASRGLEIDTRQVFGGSGIFTRAVTDAFQADAHVLFSGTQFERWGSLLVNGAGVHFDVVSLTGCRLIFGHLSGRGKVTGANGPDAFVFILSPSVSAQSVDVQNWHTTGIIDFSNGAPWHARHASDPGDSVFLTGGVEWFLWPEIFANNGNAITLTAASASYPNTTGFAAEAAGVVVRNAAGTILESSPKRDLRKGLVGVGTADRDSFSWMTVQKSTDSRLCMAVSYTGGYPGFHPHAWPQRITNGMLVGATGATPPTGWTVDGASITFAAGTSVTGAKAFTSSSAACIRQPIAMRHGHTYMAVARVKSTNLTLVAGIAHNGADNARQVMCGPVPDAGMGWTDGSTILQVVWTADSRELQAVVSLGGISALGGPGVDECLWVAVIDLTAESVLMSSGKPTTGVFEVGDVVREIDPLGTSVSHYVCTTRGVGSSGNFKSTAIT